jgi:hypothetical protein
MKRWKKVLLLLFISAVAVAGYGFYLYNKKPVDLREIPPAYTLSVTSLLQDFNKDETTANKKYLNKAIAVSGKIKEVKLEPQGQATVILESEDPLAGVTCSFYNEETAAVKKLKEGENIVIKGKCTGKLMDVILNECSIEK